MGWQCLPAPVIFNYLWIGSNGLYSSIHACTPLFSSNVVLRQFEFMIRASRAKLAPTEEGTRDKSVVLNQGYDWGLQSLRR